MTVVHIEECRAAARAAGRIGAYHIKEAMMFFLAQRKTLVPRDQWTVTLQTHLEWMEQQHDAGHILLSGPSNDRALSMYLIKTSSREEAERIAAADPFTAAGLCTFDLIEWNIHQAFGIGDFTGANRAAALAPPAPARP